jgi:transcriptional regulator with GAF, ATPase, and Fis domain
MPELYDYIQQRQNPDPDHLLRLISQNIRFSDIIGSSPAMQKLYALMDCVACSNATALLLGETGTGKELVAKAIHNQSPRKKNPLVTINCGALPASLIESELFGHERGAFTGAMGKRIGKFEMAERGTIFLDEIGELPLDLQAKLLRVLQEREFERVGGSVKVKVNVRVIAATNRDLQMEVEEKRFRSDLFFRLSIFPITIPPLRDRMDDLDDLIDFFICKYGRCAGNEVTGISSAAKNVLRRHSWPGNVRELEHTIQRNVLLTSGRIIKEISLFNEPQAKVTNGSGWPLHEAEKTHIIKALDHCKWKVSGSGGAAELLEVPGTTLNSKIKKLEIKRSTKC